MPNYTLKTFRNTKLIERFDHRQPFKMQRILNHPKNHRDISGPFGEAVDNANRFEIYDSMNERVFDGNITDVLNFVGKLK